MSGDPYVYPGTRILRNKLDIMDARQLDVFERRITTDRAAEGVPRGEFDLQHLSAIHHHLFQDVYEWAGKPRTVDISKGGSEFMPWSRIETGMNDVHRRVVANGHLRDSSPDDFAREAGRILGDVNHVHPFREGNGRTQLLYLQQLARRAGHKLDLRRIERDPWIEASRRAEDADYVPMSQCIRGALGSERSRTREQENDQGL